MAFLIQLHEISKIYHPGENPVDALQNVSFSVESGEFVAITGSSGSGKSTLMNILGCLDTPSSGSYLLEDEDVSHLSDRALSEIRNRKIGFIFQGFNLISTFNALENVELPLAYRGVPRSRRRELATDALRRVGLEKRLAHLPSQMSGGQQQRVAIARAIAARPPLILADEPTGNLDSAAGGSVMEILLELHREGKTIILITHDEAIARRAPRTLRVRDGRIASVFEKEPLSS